MILTFVHDVLLGGGATIIVSAPIPVQWNWRQGVDYGPTFQKSPFWPNTFVSECTKTPFWDRKILNSSTPHWIFLRLSGP